jgi:hypothetical protein
VGSIAISSAVSIRAADQRSPYATRPAVIVSTSTSEAPAASSTEVVCANRASRNGTIGSGTTIAAPASWTRTAVRWRVWPRYTLVDACVVTTQHAPRSTVTSSATSSPSTSPPPRLPVTTHAARPGRCGHSRRSGPDGRARWIALRSPSPRTTTEATTSRISHRYTTSPALSRRARSTSRVMRAAATPWRFGAGQSGTTAMQNTVPDRGIAATRRT